MKVLQKPAVVHAPKPFHHVAIAQGVAAIAAAVIVPCAFNIDNARAIESASSQAPVYIDKVVYAEEREIPEIEMRLRDIDQRIAEGAVRLLDNIENELTEVQLTNQTDKIDSILDELAVVKIIVS